MGLFVNTNVRSLNTQRSLNFSAKRLERSFERLSSGKRINSAKDDAAGLAISTRFTSQVRGLTAAVRNTNDGISMVQTVEGALQESVSSLQRMRELAVQAANDINNEADRFAINLEVQGLVTELDRIAESTTFNEKKVLTGEFMQGFFHIGYKADERVQVNIHDARAKALGRSAVKTTNVVTTNALDKGAGSVLINGVTIRTTSRSDDTVSTSFSSGSAISKAAAINDASKFTGVKARALETLDGDNNNIQGGTLDTETYISINGEILTSFFVDVDDASKMLLDQINSVADKTGVIGFTDENNRLVLRATDGRNVEVFVSNQDAADITGLSNGVATGGLEFSSQSQFSITGDSLDFIGLAAPVIVGVDSLQSVNKIDVLDRESANHAITILDRAIEQVSLERSSLGGLQNRLESAVRNLNNVIENVSVARSRIEDADFAIESANMSRDQVLQQAGIAILAQANQGPQVALSLLG